MQLHVSSSLCSQNLRREFGTRERERDLMQQASPYDRCHNRSPMGIPMPHTKHGQSPVTEWSARMATVGAHIFAEAD